MMKLSSRSVALQFLLSAFLAFAILTQAAEEAVVFSAMGDVPYSPEGRVRLVRDIADFNKSNHSSFMIHLGDIKRGAPPCVEPVYEDAAGLLKTISVPTFIVPGDNEWNDCADPASAWALWMRHLQNLESNWPKGIPNATPPERPKERPENFAFSLSGVLFVGINLPGGRVHDQNEWSTRLPQNAAFIAARMKYHKNEIRAAVIMAQANPNQTHEAFMVPFRAAAAAFGKPVLFLHGDGHRWIKDHPWPEKNILRVQVVEGNLEPPLEVTVTTSPEEPFVFKRAVPPNPSPPPSPP